MTWIMLLHLFRYGGGVFPNSSCNCLECFAIKYSLTGITIPSSVTSIGEGAFYNTPVVIRGYPGSTAETYATANDITFQVLAADFILPAGLTTIEADAFQNIAAVSVQIPASVTGISGNPFAGSAVRYIYGVPGSAAETFANTYDGYTFVPITE